MNRTTLYATLIGALLVSAAALGIGAAADSPRSLMSPSDYSQSKRAIEAEKRLALARCRLLDGLSKDLCKAQARAEERIQKADLEARYRGTVGAAAEARLARAKAQYDIAKTKCGDLRGDEKSACLQSAREEKTRALAEAKLAST
ncbi:MAG TPA: hypothetical protein VN878_06905 [Usitatibacter sp.]|nr:hypothetical protein [Usitatibacter sp.]